MLVGFCVLRCDPTSTFTFTTGVKQRSSADSACSGDGKTLAKLDSQMIVDSAIAFISGYVLEMESGSAQHTGISGSLIGHS